MQVVICQTVDSVNYVEIQLYFSLHFAKMHQPYFLFSGIPKGLPLARLHSDKVQRLTVGLSECNLAMEGYQDLHIAKVLQFGFEDGLYSPV